MALAFAILPWKKVRKSRTFLCREWLTTCLNAAVPSLGARAEWYEFIEYARNVFFELDGIAISGSGGLLIDRRRPDFLSEDF